MRQNLQRCIFAAAVALVMGAGPSVQGAQQSTQQGTARPISTEPNYSVDPAVAADPARVRLQEQQAAFADTERHKRMVADSDKLLMLATELKEEVAKSTKNEMSVAAIKKAGEIEKLAHDVKERMKGN